MQEKYTRLWLRITFRKEISRNLSTSEYFFTFLERIYEIQVTQQNCCVESEAFTKRKITCKSTQRSINKTKPFNFTVTQIKLLPQHKLLWAAKNPATFYSAFLKPTKKQQKHIKTRNECALSKERERGRSCKQRFGRPPSGELKAV